MDEKGTSPANLQSEQAVGYTERVAVIASTTAQEEQSGFAKPEWAEDQLEATHTHTRPSVKGAEKQPMLPEQAVGLQSHANLASGKGDSSRSTGIVRGARLHQVQIHA